MTLPGRLAYVVSHSFPHCSNGYAVRTHEIARALAAGGHDVVVMNRPGRPWDIEGFPASRPAPVEERIDGVRYLFLPNPLPPGTGLRERLRRSERVLVEAFEVFRPAAVLAASNWETAQPALYAGRRLGLPVHYEQRGFWEMTRAAEDPDFAGGAEYRHAAEQETAVAREADGVFTLTGAMRDELVRRGVPRERIALVPNGARRAPAAGPAPTRAALGLGPGPCLGYIGSLSAYEGVEDLVRLVARLRADGRPAQALIVGSDAPKGLTGTAAAGPAAARLAALAAELGVADHVRLEPQVPAARIGGYYALLDAVVLPRRRTPATELVAPLKPYEAAAHGLPVLMTDMPPLDEIAAEIGAHLFPEGDPAAMATAAARALAPDAPRPALDETLSWGARVRPILAALAPTRRGAAAPPAAAAPAPREAGFDLAQVPRAALAGRAGMPAAVIGPGRELGPRAERLTRATLLPHLATAPPGLFVIDWAGLRAAPGEWEGLWSIDAMRLNRQVMDAARIARDRGWRMRVTGPVSRAEAPLFRTVAALFEETAEPEAQA